MVNKRSSVLLLLALSLMFSITGCSKSSSSDSNESNENEMSLAVWGYEQNKEFKTLVEGFEKEYDATINVIDIDPNAYADKVTTMLASGDQTDVFAMKDVGSYVNYANKNQLLDLTNFEAKLSDEELKNYGSTLDSYRTEEGKLYALPFRKDTYVLFYNKDLFDKAGVAYPEKLTWTSYQEMAEQLTMGDNEAEKVYGAYHHKWFPILQALAANQTENDLLSGQYDFLKSYYEVFIDMQNKGTSMDYATIKTTNTSYSSVFETEKTATMIMGSFYISKLLNAIEEGEADMNWGMVSLPQLDDSKETITYGGPAGMGVNKNAANQELAKKFVEYASGEQGAILLAQMGITPAYKNDKIINEIFDIDGMPQDDLSKNALLPDKDGYEISAVSEAAEIYKILGEEHDLIMVEDNSIEEGIAKMEKRVSEVK